MKFFSKKVSALLGLTATASFIATLSLGGTFALWEDEEQAIGGIATGRVLFAAGDPGSTPDTATGNGDTVSFSVTRTHAQTLVADGSIAIPIQVDSLSQGNRGLYYSLTAPTFEEGTPFDLADDVMLFKVPSATDCQVGNAPSAQPALESTPVAATYSSTTTPTVEYWCLVASYSPSVYSNVGTVTGEIEGDSLSDSDTWSVSIDPDTSVASNPDQPIEFSYETFRPGANP